MSSMADSEEKEESGIPAVTKDTVTPATAEEKDGVGKRKAEAQAAGSGGKAARYTAGQGPASGSASTTEGRARVGPPRRSKEKAKQMVSVQPNVEASEEKEDVQLREQDVLHREAAEQQKEILKRLQLQLHEADQQKEKVQNELKGVTEKNNRLNMKAEHLKRENGRILIKALDRQEEKLKLEVEKEVLLQENTKLKKERDFEKDMAKLQAEKIKVLKEKEEFEQETEKKMKTNEKLVKELQEKVECPVCLVVPREGPVPCCPHGHITCSPCLARLRRDGNMECPTCREPMGEGKSILAKVIIEHMEHECSHEGCQEVLAFEDYKEHQFSCRYRLVMCPGSYLVCKKHVPFCEVEDHARNCEGSNKGSLSCSNLPILFRQLFRPTDAWVQSKKRESFKSMMFRVASSGDVFFLRMNKTRNLISMEVVMLSNQQACDNLRVTVSIINPNTETVFYQASFKPRPIKDTNITDVICLTIKQKRLAKAWTHNKENNSYVFTISVKIQPVEDL